MSAIYKYRKLLVRKSVFKERKAHSDGDSKTAISNIRNPDFNQYPETSNEHHDVLSKECFY